MGEQGVVLSVSDDELTVSLTRQEACAKCRACIAGLSSEEMILKVKNQCDARKNDRVNIELEEGYAIKAMFIMYGIPLVFLLAGVFAGYYGAGALGFQRFQEIAATGCGALGVFLAFLCIRTKDRRMDRRPYTPVATAVVREP